MNASSKSPDKATPLSAILLICASGFLFTCLDTAAKYLVTSGMNSLFVAWMRFAVHVALAFVLLRGWSHFALYRFNSLPKQLLRGAMLVGSTVFNFFALKTLQLAETMSIFFFAPMLIAALAGPILGEWAGWRRWIAIIVGFVGVLVITRPGFSAFQQGHMFALGACLSYSGYVLMTRAMSTTETPESLIFYSALAPTLLMLPTVPYTVTVPEHGWYWLLLVGIGASGAIGHWFVIKAYSMASTTALAPYPYLQMVWMIIAGYLVFGQLPDVWTVAGGLIIVASGLYIIHREHQLRLAERNVLDGEAEVLAKKL